jgi:hypothetical protein
MGTEDLGQGGRGEVRVDRRQAAAGARDAEEP